MKPWVTLERAPSPDGAVMVLQRRDETFVIRVDGHELMSSERHGSEEAMPRVALEALRPPAAALHPRKVLVGGLGLGYTARATLDALGPDDAVVVAELSEAVVRWNRGPLAHLAHAPLDDRRLQLELGDIGKLLATTTRQFHAILLDVDNGPQALAHASNHGLYRRTGLRTLRQRLHRGGVLVVWSAAPDAAFETSLREEGFVVATKHVPVRPGAGARHVLFVGVSP